MYVAQHMSSPPITAKPDTPVPAVREILQSHHFRHLPIVDEDVRLVGIVTDRDLRSAYPSSVIDQADHETAVQRLAETPVSAIMTAHPVSLRPQATLDDALFLLDRHKVGALPVVNQDRQVVGMFSMRDLMKAYNKLFGLGEPGSALIEIEDDGQPRILSRIAQALEDRGISFNRLVRATEAAERGGGDVIYLRVQTYNVHGVHEMLRAAGLQIIRPKAE
jgi:acetoin utilization protein AcuB